MYTFEIIVASRAKTCTTSRHLTVIATSPRELTEGLGIVNCVCLVKEMSLKRLCSKCREGAILVVAGGGALSYCSKAKS